MFPVFLCNFFFTITFNWIHHWLLWELVVKKAAKGTAAKVFVSCQKEK